MNIRSVEPFVVRLPMAKPIKMAGIEIRNADNLVVRIETDTGRVGWGESASAPGMTGEFAEGMAAAVRFLAPGLVGRDVNELTSVAAWMEGQVYGNASARAAIEIALYDLAAQAANVPASTLLGGARRVRIPVLRMLGSGVTETDCADAERLSAHGFIAWKIKVGVNDPTYDAERTRRICAVLGKGHLISADANQGWTVDQAIEYVRRVDGCGLDFLEQPVRGDDLAGMARIAQSSRVPIGADEGLHGLEDIRRHHAAGAAAGGSLKTIKLGGMAPVMQAGRLATELGMHVNLACKIAESSIAGAAIVHLAAALPAIDWGVSLSCQYLADDLAQHPLEISAGHVAVPTAPGLGVTVDEARLRRFLVG